MAIPDVIINYWAVLVCAIFSIIIGSFWYSPVLFGNAWMKIVGIKKPTKITDEVRKSMNKSYFLAIVCSFISAFVLAHFIQYFSISMFSDALQLVFWIWLGFIAPISLGVVIWEGKPWKLWLINNSYNLVNMIVMSLILISWK